MKDVLNKLLIAQDKANHFIYSLLLSLLFFILLVVANRIAEGNISLMGLAHIAGVTSFVVGVNKESVDYYSGKGTASWLDLLANLFGIGTFVFIVYLVNV
jgi:hypothetical protein